MKNILLIGGLALLAPMIANAGTCADPTPLLSNTPASGTTCGGEVGINMGGTVYGHPSQVYSVHINRAGPGGSNLGPIVLGTATREASLTTSCTQAPIAVAAAGAVDMDLTNVADGDYLLVVSTDPSIPPANPPVCGDFQITPNVLPVELKTFSVE